MDEPINPHYRVGIENDVMKAVLDSGIALENNCATHNVSKFRVHVAMLMMVLLIKKGTLIEKMGSDKALEFTIEALRKSWKAVKDQ